MESQCEALSKSKIYVYIQKKKHTHTQIQMEGQCGSAQRGVEVRGAISGMPMILGPFCLYNRSLLPLSRSLLTLVREQPRGWLRYANDTRSLLPL